MQDIPLSLYLDMGQGVHAEADVAARSTIEFTALVREVIAFLDPQASVSIELVSGSEGSLGVNLLSRVRDAVTKAGETADLIGSGLKRRRIHWLAIYVAFRIANNGVDWAQDTFMDWLISGRAPEAAKTLSKEDLHAIAADLAEMMRTEVASRPVKLLYKEVARDPKIQGLGVAERPREKPLYLVPKADFAQFSQNDPGDEGDKRDKEERLELALISPVLLPGDRKWRLLGPRGEFGASIRDGKFLEQVLTGDIGIPMRYGVLLDVSLLTHELHRDGVWRPESAEILKVHGWQAAPVQGDFLRPDK